MSTALIILIIFVGLFVLFKPSSSSSTSSSATSTAEHSSMAPGITEISSTSQFDGIVKELASTQLLVVEKLSKQYSHVKFVKIDVDKQAELARRFRVTAMPTFKFLKGGREIAELRGANPPQLNALVAQHAGPATQAFSGSGQKLGSGSSSSASAPAVPAGPVEGSLLSHISSKGLSCLNESSSHPLSSILGPSAGPKGRSYLESDVDPELLISIPFNETVKIKAISIFSGVSPAQAPKSIKLYINHNAMDFGDADSTEAAQEFDLTPEQVKGDKIELRFVKFQKVQSLHLLVKDNQEDEETTRIDSIDIYGLVGETSEKGPLPKHDHEH